MQFAVPKFGTMEAQQTCKCCNRQTRNASGDRKAPAPGCGEQLPNKIGFPVGVRGIPTAPEGARGKPGAFTVGGDQPAGSNPSNSPRLVNCSPQKLESYLVGMLLPPDQLPKAQRSETEKPKVDPTDV